MVASPLIDQGTINRLRGNVIFPDHPELNVTAPYLGRSGITVSPEGQTTQFIPTQTGAVTSPEPYQMVTITIGLLRTQNLAQLFKARIELDARLGAAKVITDATTLSSYDFANCAIQNSPSFSMTGENADYVISIHGFYIINSTLWNL